MDKINYFCTRPIWSKKWREINDIRTKRRNYGKVLIGLKKEECSFFVENEKKPEIEYKGFILSKIDMLGKPEEFTYDNLSKTKTFKNLPKEDLWIRRGTHKRGVKEYPTMTPIQNTIMNQFDRAVEILKNPQFILVCYMEKKLK